MLLHSAPMKGLFFNWSNILELSFPIPPVLPNKYKPSGCYQSWSALHEELSLPGALRRFYPSEVHFHETHPSPILLTDFLDSIYWSEYRYQCDCSLSKRVPEQCRHHSLKCLDCSALEILNQDGIQFPTNSNVAFRMEFLKYCPLPHVVRMQTGQPSVYIYFRETTSTHFLMFI